MTLDTVLMFALLTLWLGFVAVMVAGMVYGALARYRLARAGKAMSQAMNVAAAAWAEKVRR